MSTHKQDQVCTTLIEKITQGQPLDASEKAHLSQCDGCMSEVVEHLDRMAEESGASRETTGESGEQGLSPPSPEVAQALEQGRRVFAREFGL